MAHRVERKIQLSDEDKTTALGQRIASLLGPGDVLLLSGPIGAGKTHLARAIIQARLQAAGRLEDVPSPTYTLVQTYSDDTTEIWHADLYRLTDASEIAELGLLDAFETAIVLVEWPDRLGPDAPPDALSVTLTAVGNAREALLSSHDPRWVAVLRELN